VSPQLLQITQHGAIALPKGGDLVPTMSIYHQMYLEVLSGGKAKGCCYFLTTMAAMMAAWHTALQIAYAGGSVYGIPLYGALDRVTYVSPPNLPPPSPFNLVKYNDKSSPPKSTIPLYWSLLDSYCGKNECPNVKRDIKKTANQILEKVKKQFNLEAPSLVDVIVGILSNPVATALPEEAISIGPSIPAETPPPLRAPFPSRMPREPELVPPAGR
jgi:hypothetical protein